MDRASVAASVIVGVLILGAVAFTYYQTSAQVSTLSSQNANLSADNANLQNRMSSLQANLQQQVSSLGQQVSTLEQRTLTVVTLTETYVSVVTTVSTTSVTSTSTVSVYPVPDNVTVYLAPSGQFLNYEINAGSYTSMGSLANPQSFSVTPVYQGETISISITLNCPGSTGPTGSASLYLNNVLVSHANVACGGTTTGQISYVL